MLKKLTAAQRRMVVNRLTCQVADWDVVRLRQECMGMLRDELSELNDTELQARLLAYAEASGDWEAPMLMGIKDLEE